MKSKKVILIAILSFLLIIGIVIGYSTAYFIASVSNSTINSTVVTTGSMEIEFSDGPEVSLSNAIPGTYVEKTFSVKNIGTIDTYYDIYLSDVINSFVDKSDLTYTLTSSTGANVSQTTAPDIPTKIVSNQQIGINTTHNYTLRIDFKETNDNQDDNKGKEFSTVIRINEKDEAKNILFSDDFESYAENTTIVSGNTPYTLKYNGTGDSEQKVIVAQQKDGTSGNVMQLNGRNGWSSDVRYTFSADDKQYLTFDVDIKPVLGTSPISIGFASNSVSGQWSKKISGLVFRNNSFLFETEDVEYDAETTVTYDNENWYNVKMILDRTNNKFYVSLNGTLLRSDGFAAVGATPEWFAFGAGNINYNTAYYDNIKIYSTNSFPTL